MLNKIFAFFGRTKNKPKQEQKRNWSFFNRNKKKLIVDNGVSFEKDLQKRMIGVSSSRLTEDFQQNTITGSINTAIRASAVDVRNQSRTLAINSPYGSRAVAYQVANVVGADGIQPQPQIQTDGKINKPLNDKIKKVFDHWAYSRDRFSFNGRMNWRTFTQELEKAKFIDGECFIRIHETGHDLKIEIIPADRVDYGFTEQCENGNVILNGIEYDVETQKAVRYWFTGINFQTQTMNTGSRFGVEASDVIHYYDSNIAGQLRGIPAMASSIATLVQLDAWSQAVLIQKRTAASSMGFITQSAADSTSMELYLDGYDSEDTTPPEVVEEMEAGTIKLLPAGYDIKQFSTTQGGDDFDGFASKLETQIAMSLNFYKQGYMGDTSGVNYSSARFGDQQQRQSIKSIQRNIQEIVLERLFERFLSWAALSDRLDIKMTAIHEIILNTQWSFPKWESIDPIKDVNTQVTKIENGLVSRSDVILENGGDPTTVFGQIKSEKTLYVPKQANKLEVAEAPVIAAVENEPAEDQKQAA